MRTFSTLALLLFALLLVPVTHAQSGKISGFVKDAKTGEALIGVNVIVDGTTIGAATDVEGYYVILNVSPGFYNIRATMIGYAPQTVQNIRVAINQTTEVNFELQDQTISTEEIVVIAKEPIVQKDVSSSKVNLNIKEIQNLPIVDAKSVLTLQAGIQSGSEGIIVRGGGSDQTAFLVNGLSMRSARDNNSFTSISFTAIEEIQVQTGGFNAEYGQIRSGLVNVVTKEGDKEKYTFSMLGRYSPPTAKHFGQSPMSADAYWMRPFVDPQVAFVGTKSGWATNTWLQRQYPEFVGWNQISQQTLIDDDPTNDLSPQAAQQVYLYQHRRMLDIENPDWNIDMSLAGPVPFVSKPLGNLRFLLAYRKNETMYMIPLSRKGLYDFTYQAKLTSDIGTGMKISLEGLYGQTQGTTRSASGAPIFINSSAQIASNLSRFSQFKTAENRVFTDDYWAPSTALTNSIGLKFTHVLNAETFYEVRVSRFANEYSTVPNRLRDTTGVITIGGVRFDEAPFGYWPQPTFGVNNFRMSVGFSTARDTSKTYTYNMKFDISSQIDKYNNIKAGFEFNYTEFLIRAGQFDAFLPDGNFSDIYDKFPIFAALYVQDKFEYEGMIANLGVRLDYSHAGGEWYVWDEYNSAFSSAKSADVDQLLKKEPTEKKITVSPRLGIAFPISIDSKLYFNYGHFQQIPTPGNLFTFRRKTFDGRVLYVANPNVELPRTIAYEIGYEHNVLDMFLVRLAGYYKDVTNQPLAVNFVSRNGAVNYETTEPNSYADIRGFELTITKNRGDWVQGFINYTYSVSTSGRYGFYNYYENKSTQRDYEATTTSNEQFKPIPQPYARANVDFFTPIDFGPEFAGLHLLGDIRLNVLAAWSAGDYFTWTGGSGDIPGVIYNVQWTDYWNVDLRISKNFNFGPLNLQIFADVYNALNIKRMTGPGYAFIDSQDYLDYMKSLHLPEDAFADFPKGPDGKPKTGYSNWKEGAGFVFGEDRPGDYRVGPYIPWDDNASESQKEEWRKNKSYIDMPNQEYLTFLNPRDIFWGVRVNYSF